jgi:DNA-directed RNA polymerase subunit omega
VATAAGTLGARATRRGEGAAQSSTHPRPRERDEQRHREHSTTSLEVAPIARIDDLMDKVDSKFHLVHLAAKRAREINGYYAQLGEGLGQYVPPLVSTDSNKPLSVALEEIAQTKIEGTEPSEASAEDPLAFIGPDDEAAEGDEGDTSA